MNYLTGKMNITDNTVSIHHYTSSWVRKKSLLRRVVGSILRYLGIINLIAWFYTNKNQIIEKCTIYLGALLEKRAKK